MKYDRRSPEVIHVMFSPEETPLVTRALAEHSGEMDELWEHGENPVHDYHKRLTKWSCATLVYWGDTTEHLKDALIYLDETTSDAIDEIFDNIDDSQRVRKAEHRYRMKYQAQVLLMDMNIEEIYSDYLHGLNKT